MDGFAIGCMLLALPATEFDKCICIPESNDSLNYKSKEGKLGIKTDIIVFNS